MESVSFVLELDRGSEPLSGRISGDGDEAVEFSGWLGLAEVLQQMLDETTNTGEGQ